MPETPYPAPRFGAALVAMLAWLTIIGPASAIGGTAAFVARAESRWPTVADQGFWLVHQAVLSLGVAIQLGLMLSAAWLLIRRRVSATVRRVDGLVWGAAFFAVLALLASPDQLQPWTGPLSYHLAAMLVAAVLASTYLRRSQRVAAIYSEDRAQATEVFE